MDKRKNYYLVLDVEGVGECSNALTYDLGFAIADKKGNIYEKHSYVIREIFEGQKELMKSSAEVFCVQNQSPIILKKQIKQMYL